jgi:radical SAM superfamily enzyme YgiQ (UPF0313 family)
MQGALDIVGKHKTLMPNAALLTLIALTPTELGIDYVYCDEHLTPIDWDLDCDLVALTGYTLQAERMRQIGDRFHARGVPVAVGGIYATINPDAAAQLADYLFVGEAEYTWPKFLRDWQAARPQSRYQQQEFTDLRHVPAPDLSRIQAKDYLYFSVQTSRGCPNNCDFCDVVGIAGRKRRSKTIPQILQEVRNAHAVGAETVFFSDDNFFVNRRFTVRLLRELVAWNRTLDRPLSFSTQATLLIGSDEEVLTLLADARFRVIFVGLETIKRECLEEVNKGQLARHDPYQIIPRLSSYGIVPFLGMIVGFDHDGPSVFGEIEEFLQVTGSPIASISVLNAPQNTALFRRMQSAGRLVEDFRGFWHDTTNIIPKQMTREELHLRHRELFKRIYEPESFERRMIRWLENVRYLTSFYSTRRKNLHRFWLILRVVRHFMFRVPSPMRAMFFRVVKAAWRINPRLVSQAVSILVQYWHYYDFSHKEAWNVRAWPGRELPAD